jgi:predicted nucleotidyltransferase
MGAYRDLLSAALFGKTRRNVLGLLFVEPQKSFYLREIVRRTSGGQGSVQRELRRLSDAGIISRHGAGRAITYQANSASPIFQELSGLLAKTAGIVEQLRRALSPLRQDIDVGFLYGSYARESHLRPASDIDLMVVGDVSFGNVVEHTALAQAQLGRDVNPTVYSRDEFAKRSRDGSPFLRDVLEHPKLFLIGGPRELERLAQMGMADQPQTDARRDPGTASRRRTRPSRQ